MSNRSETFGRLLKGAINSIAAYEGKTAPAIEDALGEQIGVAGSTIQRYKTGYLPTEPRVVQILAKAAVSRGYLSRMWLQRFLQAARYPNPDALVAQFVDVFGSTPSSRDERTMPTGTLTFLFTDIEGSTTRWEHHPEAMEHALARHDELLHQAIDAYGGQVFKTVGDAFQAVFTTTSVALEAAIAAQRALGAESWGPIKPLQVRMALHVGSVQLRDDDYVGQPMNRVARLCAAGHGGQVLLSNAAQELVRDVLPKGVTLRDLGEHRLKDLVRPEHIFQLVIPDLPADFAPLRTLDSYTHNLPAQTTPLIGREAEVHDISERVRRDGIRLLTLTGPGGIGKTRVALQAAADLLDDFPDGVFFVTLAPIRDPARVPAAIAKTLGYHDAGEQEVLEQIKTDFKHKRALFVLDNFEQVAAAGLYVTELLTAAPQLKVIITSREVLHLYGEHEYMVPPLSLPDLQHLPPIERLTQYEAVRLFIERAQAVRPDFAITADNAPAVAEICTRLDGLPLAIELAAARCKLFPPKALLARLDKRLHLLAGGPRDLPARQQTLRGAIAWSYNLLDAAEQALFNRLGVFVSGCTLVTAEQVLADDRARDEAELTAYIPGRSVLDGLRSLSDKSLLKQDEIAEDGPRFVMLETLHEYAWEQLEVSGEHVMLRRRHAEHYLDFAKTVTPELFGAQQKYWFARLEEEHDNLRAALQWMLDQGEEERALDFCAALGEFWLSRGYFNEGLRWMDTVLAQTRDLTLPVRARVLYSAGSLAFQQSDFARARICYDQSLALARELHDPYLTALGLEGVASIVRKQGDLVQARAMYEESLAMLRELGSVQTIPWSQFRLAQVLLRQGEHAQAQQLSEESLAGLRKADDQLGVACVLGLQGEIAALRGDATQAAALLRESLILARENGGFLVVALGLVRLAGGDTAKHHPIPMARLFGAAETLLDTLDIRITAAERSEWERNVSALCGNLDAEAYQAAWQEGRGMAFEQAIAEALGVAR